MADRVQLATVKLTGWKAVGVLAVLATYLAVRYVNRQVTLQTAGREAVRSWVVLELQRHTVGTPQAAAQFDSAAATELARVSDIEIRSISARGLSDNVVARVEIAVHGAVPSDGRPVRYYRLVYSSVTGWRVLGASSALRYYMDLW